MRTPWEGKRCSEPTHRRICLRVDGKPRREKKTGPVIPEFWALATNLETILLGQWLRIFLLQVRDVLWGKRRVGRKECTATFF